MLTPVRTFWPPGAFLRRVPPEAWVCRVPLWRGACLDSRARHCRLPLSRGVPKLRDTAAPPETFARIPGALRCFVRSKRMALQQRVIAGPEAG
jgi:hypothetical protein